MEKYADKMSVERSIERWENEGGEVKAFPEVRMNLGVRTNDKAILICIGCLVVLPFSYWLVKKIGTEIIFEHRNFKFKKEIFK